MKVHDYVFAAFDLATRKATRLRLIQLTAGDDQRQDNRKPCSEWRCSWIVREGEQLSSAFCFVVQWTAAWAYGWFFNEVLLLLVLQSDTVVLAKPRHIMGWLESHSCFNQHARLGNA